MRSFDFEEIMSIRNVDLMRPIVVEALSSLFIAERKKIYVPEKKIILMEQVSETFMGVSKNEGGLIV